MLFTKFLLFCSLYMFFSNFSKKLISLLSLEVMMILMIFSFFYLVKGSNTNLFSILLIFLIMMVLDSVLGMSLLISSCRISMKKNHSFF